MRRIGMTSIGSFDHPMIERDSVLCRHVLYRINNDEFLAS